MTKTITIAQIPDFLAQTKPFSSLNQNQINTLSAKCQLLRYRPGQAVFEREKMPTQIVMIYEGKARQLAYDQRKQSLVSLRLIGPGEILGWVSLIRGIASDTIIASTEIIAITLPAAEFLNYVKSHSSLREYFQTQVSETEVFELLGLELQRRADSLTNLKDLTLKLTSAATAVNLPNGDVDLAKLAPEYLWFVSQGNLGDFNAGKLLLCDRAQVKKLSSNGGARLIGVPFGLISQSTTPEVEITDSEIKDQAGGALAPGDRVPEIPYAPERPPEPEFDPNAPRPKYPFVRGSGKIDAPLACFEMLAKQSGIRIRKDLLRRVIKDQLATTGRLTLQACGGVAASMGLNPQLVVIPPNLVGRLKAPAMIRWKNSFALLFDINQRELVIAIPEKGIIRKKPEKFAKECDAENGQIQVLLLQKLDTENKDKFNFWWFLPELVKYKGTLFQVFLASFFVQLMGLANPLLTQVIIDKVIGQRSLDTLNVLGVLMVGVALFEGLLTGLRTYLFVDTTNRIDLSLSSQVIDHLLRLPLDYFDRRRVGELAGRVGELERIRQFLTGTALTVVLDAVFSVIYIAVMLSYSLLMTAVALVTVPLFTALILLVSPLVERLLRYRAERYADAQSYLVEVLSGIQTVKAQTIELNSRWSWYERYARYVSAGFDTVKTQTTAGSISGFLNKLSSLLLLWVGATLVLENKMTLGELIAFRIIASNVTGSLLRFVQVWQTFQETAMSVERLRDILEAHPEADESDRQNIPLPEIQGAVRFEDVSFRFNKSGPLNLVNINLEFEAGQFVGIVGQSGSGKSTLMKLLQRLYPPATGRIFIDSYDIAKVELYSLRRQIGVVLQDTLLFNGSVQDNIALTNPDATTEEVVAAAKIAAAHDFIMGLPNGYNTIVGERGASLSGGQRQRIAIARTVLQNPHLLILDEATSALDYRSEREVCDNLRKAFKGRTVFFITHRLQTVKEADVILMMDQGSVVEQGKHDELMALKGFYYCLYQQQESQM